MRLTIGLPSWNNPVELWFTLTSLRMYHQLGNTELLVLDNAGNDQIKKISKTLKATYEKYTEKAGPQQARNRIFEVASGDFVLCIDSHILMWPGAIKKLRQWIKNNPELTKNLILGPMTYAAQIKKNTVVTKWLPVWRANMFGIWDKPFPAHSLSEDPLEIEMSALGLFGCKRDSWLGFHPDNIGFGSAEGYLHEKYRKAGRKCLCLPFLRWIHNFNKENATFLNTIEGRIANYLRSFKEVDWDIKPIYDHFGYKITKAVAERNNL